jgi:hypothetical protein
VTPRTERGFQENPSRLFDGHSARIGRPALLIVHEEHLKKQSRFLGTIRHQEGNGPGGIIVVGTVFGFRMLTVT